MTHSVKLRFFDLFLKEYPVRSFITILALFIGGVLEGLGIAMLIPLLDSLLDVNQTSDGAISQVLSDIFQHLSIKPDLKILLIMFCGFLTFKGFIAIIAMREVAKTSSIVASNIRERLIGSVLNAKWNYFTTLPAGRVANALSTESERVSLFYLMGCTMLSDIFLVVVYFCLALFASWQLSIAGIIAGTVVMVLMRGFIKLTRQAGQKQTSSLNRMIENTSESLNLAKTIKAMGQGHHYSNLVKRDIQHLQDAQFNSYFSRETLRLMREPIIAIFIAAGLFISVEFFKYDLASIMLLAFVFMRMSMKFLGIQGGYQRLVEQYSAFESLQSLVHSAKEHEETHKGSKQLSLSKAITLESVQFQHDNKEIFKDLSFEFPANQINAIIGPSGSGKTTLTDLILGFYTPHTGRILLDETDLSDINITAWRESIGYVPQENGLFFDTIRNNLTLGNSDISNSDIENALKQSGAYDFVQELQDNLNFNVGEQGRKLSGGQRQRLTIARALLRKPLLLILDEPTSALDPKTETELLETLKKLSTSLTILVISHSKNVANVSDTVLDLSKGE